MSYGTDEEFEVSTSREDFIASEFSEAGTGMGPELLGVLEVEDERLESCMSSILLPKMFLFLLTASISGPVGTKVRDRYFLFPSSPSLWL
jgi:hypothetical protein